ncbi:Hypothetical protein NTJ_02351 [Nesidiocoris tenuis]|uniref:Uncharacterized protein n=1 Tax=Nesidiocoris tenuis TaxID=355587 RepID=A0ABN7AB42_9HEMI|nr:Hypothetical protein NTJ_02351 [Nesidiocoris tenuis]
MLDRSSCSYDEVSDKVASDWLDMEQRDHEDGNQSVFGIMMQQLEKVRARKLELAGLENASILTHLTHLFHTNRL